MLLLANERVVLTAPSLDAGAFFVDALRPVPIDEVRRAFAPELERALVEKARRLAGLVTGTRD